MGANLSWLHVARAALDSHNPAMYELFFSTGTACFAPLMVLKEAKFSHQVTVIDIAAGAHRAPEYLAINPAGKVPALKMPDGQILTEASAICLYLADRHNLREIAPGVEDDDRALFLKSLIYLATSVQDHYKRYYYPKRYTIDCRNDAGIKVKALELLFESLMPLEDQIKANGPYLLGNRSSVADTYLVMLVTWFPDLDKLFKAFPTIKKCFDLIASRPVIKTGLEQQTQISVGH